VLLHKLKIINYHLNFQLVSTNAVAISSLKSIGLGFVIIKLVSSAKRTGLELILIISGNSLI
jgi:hypothetical protein